MYIKKYKNLIIALTMIIFFSFNNVKAESINFNTMTDLNFAYAYNYNITNNTSENQNILNNRYERNVGNYYYTKFTYTLKGTNHIRLRYNANNNLNGKYNIYFTVVANNNDVSNYNAIITRGTIEYPCSFNNTWSHSDSDETGLTVSNNNGVLSYVCKNVEIYPTSQIDIRLMNETGNWGTEQSFAISKFITLQKEDSISNSIDNQTNEIINPDISEESKQEIDDSKFNDYEGKEQELNDIVKNTDFSNVGINMESNTTSFIWNIIERIKNSSVEFSAFIINILSLGVIKLIFAR